MARAEHRHQVAARAARAALQVAGELVELADRSLQVLLADLVVGGRHPAQRFSRRAPFSLPLHHWLRATRRTRRCRAARRARRRRRLRLQELQRLDVEQRLRLADDVGVAQRLEELLGAVEVAHPDADGAEALRHVRVGAGASHDAVLRREAHRLLVEGADRHARVEDLERVDVLDDREQVLVVGHGVQAVERVRHVDEAALGA